jgi:hypothetical protein
MQIKKLTSAKETINKFKTGLFSKLFVIIRCLRLSQKKQPHPNNKLLIVCIFQGISVKQILEIF